MPQTGYGLITASNVNIRQVPNGSVLGRLQYNDVIYIAGSAVDTSGVLWYQVTVMGSNLTGYVHSGFARFMTQQEVNDYLNRPTPAPTPQWTPTPAPVSGYARVSWQSTALRSAPSGSGAWLKTLYASNVVYVTGQSVDSASTRWYSVRAEDGTYGFVLSASVVMMTQAEVDAYLNSLKPTPVPTAQPTLNPNYTYAVVKMNNVNFRNAPNGGVIRRMQSGEIVRVLSETPVTEGGYSWYQVQSNGDNGYLRADMIDFIQVKPTPTPTATATPYVTSTPSPVPTATASPAPLPTAGALSVLDRIRIAIDTARYTEFAKEKTDAVSYAIRDFDGDKLVELLLIAPITQAGGGKGLRLEAFKLVGGEVTSLAIYDFAPSMKALTRTQVLLQRQGGSELLYVQQQDTTTNQATYSRQLALVGGAWSEVQTSGTPETSEVLLTATSDLIGNITWEDRSTLHESPADDEAAEREMQAYTSILQVFLQLFGEMSQGNG